MNTAVAIDPKVPMGAIYDYCKRQFVQVPRAMIRTPEPPKKKENKK